MKGKTDELMTMVGERVDALVNLDMPSRNVAHILYPSPVLKVRSHYASRRRDSSTKGYTWRSGLYRGGMAGQTPYYAGYRGD